MNFLRSVFLFSFFFALSATVTSAETIWAYKCSENYCQKTRYDPSNASNLLSLGECRIFCSKFASLWPQPSGKLLLQKTTSQLNINSIDILLDNTGDASSSLRELIGRASKRFKKQISNFSEKKRNLKAGGNSLQVHVMVADVQKQQYHHDVNESYSLNITLTKTSAKRILAFVNADNFFGARHALETLSQLIYFDEIAREIKIPTQVYIEDAPRYTHRGILLDTSRNFISVEAIKRTLEGMAASKLNVFHWHLTDTHSFPLEVQSVPELSKIGAYSPEKTYTKEDVAEVLAYAKERGIFVLPEFDAPAHVGAGWQNTGLLACFNKKPWQEYCAEPPCGQLDPTQEGVYLMLQKIYREMQQQFDPFAFHMGGDEVNENCWQSEQRIVDWMTERNMSINDDGFMQLWNHFQSNALKVYRETTQQKASPIILWTSKLTSPKFLTKYLDNETYIIQIWTKGDDEQVKNLLRNDFRVILSNYEALYFDCGFSGWVNDGNNWCSPYIGWQKVYENKPSKITDKGKQHLILGSEATLWTEQVDDAVVDSRLWPRSAAMAETLWSEPATSWKEAEDRFVIHRDRLVNLGLGADAVQPVWCQQHQNSCPLDGKHN